MGRYERREGELPPGQRMQRGWPVTHYGPVPRFKADRWEFRVFGATADGGKTCWNHEQFSALPYDSVVADFHCVTRFSTLDNGWEGIATREVLRQVAHTTDAKQSAQITTTTVTMGRTLTMSGTYVWGAHAGFDLNMPTAQTGMSALTKASTIDTRFVNGAYYYGVQPQPEGPLKGKHWLRVDASAVLGGDSSQAVQQGMQQNPTAGLSGLATSPDTKKLGAETVDGKATRHYRGSADMSALTKGDGTSSAEQKRLSQAFGSGDATIDVWVDAQNLPVRMVEVIGNSKVTMDFKSFGGARTIVVPPAADTADVTKQVARNKAASTT